MELGEIVFLLTIDALARDDWVTKVVENIELSKIVRPTYILIKDTLSVPYFWIFTLNTILGTFLIYFTIDLIKAGFSISMIVYMCSSTISIIVKLVCLAVLSEDMQNAKEEAVKGVW